MNAEIRVLPHCEPDQIQCARCPRTFPCVLPLAPTPRFCSVKCAEASRAARQGA